VKDWEAIREKRKDLTEYVIHWVKSRVVDGKWKSSFEILTDIIECGYLKPSFSVMTSLYGGSPKPTVKGPYPAVCFTEQTLDNFMISCETLSNRYRPYGIALYKRALHEYGGRPVIYGGEDILGVPLMPNEAGYEKDKEVYKNGLPREHQYLWIRYQPIPNQNGYVVDWTHEREWRCRVRTYHDLKFGNTPPEGIPLLLPAIYDQEREDHIYYLPKILVRDGDEKETIEEVIKELLPEWLGACQSSYLKNYFSVLPKVNVVVLSELQGDTEAIKLDWVIHKKAADSE
jgi:hypothetical protein